MIKSYMVRSWVWYAKSRDTIFWLQVIFCNHLEVSLRLQLENCGFFWWLQSGYCYWLLLIVMHEHLKKNSLGYFFWRAWNSSSNPFLYYSFCCWTKSVTGVGLVPVLGWRRLCVNKEKILFIDVLYSPHTSYTKVIYNWPKP